VTFDISLKVEKIRERWASPSVTVSTTKKYLKQLIRTDANQIWLAALSFIEAVMTLILLGISKMLAAFEWNMKYPLLLSGLVVRRLLNLEINLDVPYSFIAIICRFGFCSFGSQLFYDF